MSNAAAMAVSSMRTRSADALGHAAISVGYFVGGLALLVTFWWLVIYLASKNPSLSQFASFGPIPAFKSMAHMWETGHAQKALVAREKAK